MINNKIEHRERMLKACVLLQYAVQIHGNTNKYRMTQREKEEQKKQKQREREKRVSVQRCVIKWHKPRMDSVVVTFARPAAFDPMQVYLPACFAETGSIFNELLRFPWKRMETSSTYAAIGSSLKYHVMLYGESPCKTAQVN